jgi:hypothetical protein
MRVQITHTELGSDRALEIWLPSTAVPIYLRPGESTIVHASWLRRVTLGEGPTLAELDDGKATSAKPKPEPVEELR